MNFTDAIKELNPGIPRQTFRSACGWVNVEDVAPLVLSYRRPAPYARLCDDARGAAWRLGLWPHTRTYTET